MVAIGTEIVRTELIYHSAKLERVDYIGTTYGCHECKDSLEPQFIKDEEKPALLPHSYVSPGLVAHVMHAKFVNTMPFYRQEKDFETLFGVKIGRGTMAHWTIYASENHFSPLYDYFHRLLLKRRFLCADETLVQGYLYINRLFDYERQYRQKCLSKKQLENRRLKDQKPVIEAFLKWLDRVP